MFQLSFYGALGIFGLFPFGLANLALVGLLVRYVRYHLEVADAYVVNKGRAIALIAIVANGLLVCHGFDPVTTDFLIHSRERSRIVAKLETLDLHDGVLYRIAGIDPRGAEEITARRSGDALVATFIRPTPGRGTGRYIYRSDGRPPAIEGARPLRSQWFWIVSPSNEAGR